MGVKVAGGDKCSSLLVINNVAVLKHRSRVYTGIKTNSMFEPFSLSTKKVFFAKYAKIGF
jgi:hypothetical protein